MKNNFIKLALLAVVTASLIGCNKKEELPPIVNTDESTIIKNAKNTDEYLKKQDYKSIAYAYIYNIKEGLQSYESSTTGTVRAKLLVFNYDIKYSSITYKYGSTFYSKDDSKSTFSNVQNEFYMVDKEKILVSRDLKKYEVYTLEDYHKVSYSPNQYTVMGYIFNDKSIIGTEVLNEKGDTVSIKYTLDNEAATNLVKVDFKNNGDLSSYPTFKKIELTLTMKRDFTPISYGIHAVYDASRPVLGTAEVTQNSECLFSKVNEKITIPNESFLSEQLGAKPSEIVIDDKERTAKDDLLAALGKLDWANGVNINGNLSLNLLGSPIALNIDTYVAFDMKRLAADKLFNILSFYLKVEGDETFNSLVSIIKTFAGDQLGEYAPLLDSFKRLEIVYDGDGNLYLTPTNQNEIHPAMLKIKLTDIVSLIVQQVNVYALITGATADPLLFEKSNVVDQNNYQIDISLNQVAVLAIKAGLNTIFANEQYAMLKTLLNYKDFDSVKLSIQVANGVVKSLDGSFNYVKDGEKEEIVSLLKLHLDAENKSFDYASKIKEAKELYEAYTSILDIKARLNYILNNVYVNRSYLNNLDKIYAEYQALNDTQKAFIGGDIDRDYARIKENVNNVLIFLDVYRKYDLNNLTNEDILALSKAYNANSLDSNLLKGEIGDENYSKISSLYNLVDYSSFDSALSKIEGDNENAWGLTEKEIKDIKLLYDISKYETSVKTQLMLKLLLGGKSISVDTLETKINNLFNNLQQA